MSPLSLRSTIARPLLGLVVACAAALWAGPASAATAEIEKVFAGPVAVGGPCGPDATATNTAASAYTDFCLAFRASDGPPTDVDLKRQVIDTPQGFAGTADEFPQCTDAQFAVDDPGNASCPPASQMGEVASDITVALGDPFGPDASPLLTSLALAETVKMNGDIDLEPTGPVFNLEHSDNEVARLGIDLRPSAFGLTNEPNVKLIVRVSLRPAPDVGLRSFVDDLPTRADTTAFGTDKDLTVREFSLVFWGTPRGAMPGPFAFVGADCTRDQQASINAVAYDGTPSSGVSAPYRLTGCDNPAIQFKPSITVSTTENRPDVTTATSVRVGFGRSTDPGYVASAVRTAVVALPDGLAFSGQIASGQNGLPLCTPALYGQSTVEPSRCPEASAIGDVRLVTPTLDKPLTGRVFLGAQPAPGALPDLYIEAELGPGVDAPRVKLRGSLAIDAANRIVTTLTDLPELPVSEFVLNFRGGDHAAIVTPTSCGTFSGAMAATPYSTPGTATDLPITYAVSDDCAGATGFAPSVAFAIDRPMAGAASPLTTAITRPDRSERIARIRIDLPAGVLANLKGVPECYQADARAGACSEATRIGSVSSLVGVGPAPFAAAGSVYLTDRSPGAVAGIALKVPVVFGDVDLGVLNVLARVEIRPGDLGLRLLAEVPERFRGIPLNVRAITVRLDRPGFSLNPTNCGVLASTSQLASFGGTIADARATVQVGGCEGLAFEPRLDAAVTGSTSRLDRPMVSVRIQNAEGASALRAATVTLPIGLGVDLAQIPRGCDRGEFLAGGCPATAIVGRVNGALSIADERLVGNLYLLKPARGKVFPGLGLAFTGRFAGRVAGEASVDTKTGQLITSFPVVPDLPLTDLQIDVLGGRGGILVSNGKLCSGKPSDFEATFGSQSGRGATQRARTYCGVTLGEKAPAVRGRLRGTRSGRPSLALSISSKAAGQRIRRLDVSLPAGFSVSTSRATRSSYLRVSKLTTRGKAKTKRTGRYAFRATLPKRGSSQARVLARGGAITLSRKSLRRSRKTVTVVATIRYTSGATVVVPVRVKPR